MANSWTTIHFATMTSKTTRGVLALLLLSQAFCRETSAPENERTDFLVAISGYDGLVHLIDKDGQPTASISCGQGCSLYHPQFSRNGKTLAMIGYDANRFSILYLADANGGNLREITRTPSVSEPFIHGTTRYAANYYDQTWSESGRLAYAKRDTIFQLLPGSSSPVRIVSGVGAGGLTWLPGDTAISFENKSLKIVNVTTGSIRQFGPFAANVRSHDWAPDGSAAVITVSVPDTARYRVYKVDVRSGSSTLMGTHSLVQVPCWSDDSKSIAFVAQDYPDRSRLYVTEIGNPVERELLANLEVGMEAIWTDESKRLVALSNRGFAVTDVASDTATFIPSHIAMNGFAVSTGRCGRMFYLLPDGY